MLSGWKFVDEQQQLGLKWWMGCFVAEMLQAQHQDQNQNQKQFELKKVVEEVVKLNVVVLNLCVKGLIRVRLL